MRTLTKEQLGTAPMQCLCGWTGKASKGELREGCDVAYSEEKLAQCRKELEKLQALCEANPRVADCVGKKLTEDPQFDLPGWLPPPGRAKAIFVQCPRCGMTAALAGSDFEPVRVASEEVTA